jgi:hypothetical protein
MDPLFGFTSGTEIRAHLAQGGTQPWQSKDFRTSAAAVAKGLAEDLIEIEPLGDGWLFAGRFSTGGLLGSWHSVTGFKMPAYIFWDDVDQARRYAKTVADWADWSKPETGNRFTYGPCRDCRRLAFAAKRARDPNWKYIPPTPMATVAQVTAIAMIENDHSSDLGGSERGSKWRRHNPDELGAMTRDALQAYLEELVDAVVSLKGEQVRAKIVDRLRTANRSARLTGREPPVWGYHD